MITLFFIFSLLAQQKINTIDDIEFDGIQLPHMLTIYTKTLPEKKVDIPNNTITLVFYNTLLPQKNRFSINTSGFTTANLQHILPSYQSSSNTTFIQLQLKKMVEIEIHAQKNSIEIAFEPIYNAAVSKIKNTATRMPANEKEPNENINPAITEFLTNSKSKQFKGKTITLKTKDADIRDVLRLIGEASGFNMVISEGVSGTLNMSLEDVPWDQALEVVLTTNRLGAERLHNILRIMPLKILQTEKEEQLSARLATQAAAPKATRIFPINYASLKDLQTEIQQFVVALAHGGNATSATQGGIGTAGIVQLDNRTNSIIVYDTLENLEKVRKLIDILDAQTPQVMIEAKIVEANESFSSALAGNLGIGEKSTAVFSVLGGNPLDNLLSQPSSFFTGASTQVPSAASLGMAPLMGVLPGNFVLNTFLNWGESIGNITIVASPKTVVLNKEQASIVHGTPVAVPGQTTVPGVGLVGITTVQQANISLQVTPTVTNDGGIMMTLDVQKNVPEATAGGTSGIGTRSLTTKVIVDDNNTLVIGGLYQKEETNSVTGVPFLRKIPLLGALFSTKSDASRKSELFIFITPRIINNLSAGKRDANS